MELLSVVLVALAISQTNGNGTEVEFSKDNYACPANSADERKIELVVENETKNLEEALFAYTELLKEMSKNLEIHC